MPQSVSLSVDIGGTFTDVVLVKGASASSHKTLTTHGRLLDGFFAGVEHVMRDADLRPDQIDGVLVHATTIVTNLLIERTGKTTALITTAGFTDVLRLRTEHRYDIYDTQIEFQDHLVSADLTFGVNEATLADGSIEQSVETTDIIALAALLRSRGVESVGICLKNSYRNSANEKQVAEILRRELPEIFISISSDIAPQIGEYIRASTTAANAYAVPSFQPYIGQVIEKMKVDGYISRPLIMLSSGGSISLSTAGRMPIRVLESGPAAGVSGAAAVALALDAPSALAFDVGGTTAKVCLIQNGRPLVTDRFEIDRRYRFKEGSGLPVATPCIDLIEIGAGGGSIADLDQFGLLKVGPRSAGSAPGPACFARGGIEATVTDANVVLGMVDPQRFRIEGRALDIDKAREAISRLSERLGTAPLETARRIFRYVTEAMASAVRTHAAERGVDYRGIPLMAFGGGGPIHACEVAKVLGSSSVIFPPFASVFSALGALLSPPRMDLVRSQLFSLSKANWGATGDLLAEMEEEARVALTEAGCKPGDIRFRYELAMRYLGQQHQLRVPLTAAPTKDTVSDIIRQSFEAAYLKSYGLVQADVAVEIVAVHLVAEGAANATTDLSSVSSADISGAARWRHVGLWDTDVDVVSREGFTSREAISGPLIIEESGTTLLIPPGWSVRLGAAGCIIASMEGSTNA